MSRRALAVAVALLLAGGVASGAPAKRPSAEELRGVRSSERYRAGREAAVDLARLTGVSMTPLFGMSVLGLQAWLQASPGERARLPWYERPAFFVPGILFLVVLWVGHRLPVIHRLAKLIQVWEDKIVAALAIPIVANTFAAAASRPLSLAWGLAVEPSAQAAGSGVVADAAGAVSHGAAWLLGVLVGAIVWLASHAINVLVLVSPFSLIDWLLKGLRAALLGLLLWATLESPWLGLAVSLAYTLVGLVLAGWTFRLLVFEIVFSRDLLGRRWNLPPREEPAPRAFASSGLPGVKPRTLGRVVARPGGLAFRYRPWLVRRARELPLPASGELAVGRGALGPMLLELDPERDAGRVLVRFPPRYRLDARRLARTLGGLRVEAPSARLSPWGWLDEALGRRPAIRAVAPA